MCSDALKLQCCNARNLVHVTPIIPCTIPVIRLFRTHLEENKYCFHTLNTKSTFLSIIK